MLEARALVLHVAAFQNVIGQQCHDVLGQRVPEVALQSDGLAAEGTHEDVGEGARGQVAAGDAVFEASGLVQGDEEKAELHTLHFARGGRSFLGKVFRVANFGHGYAHRVHLVGG